MKQTFYITIKILFFTSILTGCFLFGIILYFIHHQQIDFSSLEHTNSKKPSLLLDDQGKEWARFSLDKREPILFNEMPPILINAFLAAEDRTFFKHKGISLKGIARSAIINLYHRSMAQGASTITQQLIRLLYFEPKKTFRRKVQEQITALIVEQQCTKEQILQTYLNNIYFGCGIYGVQAACKRFWNIAIDEITASQAATLAGIVRSPLTYCPLLHPENSVKRRNVVLSLMHKQNYLTYDEYMYARSENLMIAPAAEKKGACHLQELIRQEVEKLVGHEKLYGGGLTIKTTLNQKIQKAAEEVFFKNILRLRNDLDSKIDGGFIAIDVKTGHIKALIGGFDYQASQFNRATQARRQIGSLLKPIVYAQALCNGSSFDEVEQDEPLSLISGGTLWEPRNSTCRFDGPMTLANALSISNNIITIKTLLKNGIHQTINLAHKMGIEQDLPPYPSLALGCIDTTLLEISGTFNTFAAQGIYKKPFCLEWIKDEWGTKIWKQTPHRREAFSPQVAYQIIKVLQLSLKRISKKLNFELPFDGFYKTGTTNDSRNCWLLGSTPSLTTGVYLGRDDNKSIGANIFALQTAFPFYREFNEAIGSQPSTFDRPAGLIDISIDRYLGTRVEKQNPRAIEISITQGHSVSN